MIARRAVVADAAEIVRLRAVMLRSMRRESWDDGWREPARQALVSRLAGDQLAAFVVDWPGEAGLVRPRGALTLAACAVGTVEERLGGPGDPDGRAGYVFNVATDPDMRRRGYSRACTGALLDWFRDQGVCRVDLRASAEAEPLYRSLGFTRTTDPAMRLRLT